MKNTIATIVRERNHVTFSELQLAIPGFEGDMMITVGSDHHMIFWPWCSEEAVTAIEELLRERAIFFHPTSLMTHLPYEIYPRLPIAKRPPADGYAEPHWCPVCICDHPFDPKARKRTW